jgi:16S rRNA (adenine1518-N6/adenine1519-N6)-dimethyltransferase
LAKKTTRPVAKKSLGQHFLVDRSVVRQALALAQLKPDDLVVEIGPGVGILTEALLEEAAEVLAIELDSRMISYLEQNLSNRLTLLQEDVLQVDWQKLLGQSKVPVKVVANLPYYITSPIIQRLLAFRELFSTMVLMVQKEVAQRIAAEPGGKDYGVLSVAVQYQAQVELGPVIGPEAFRPAPRVHSVLIRLTPRPQPLVETAPDLFFRVVRSAFRLRRKTILNSLLAANLLAYQDKGEQREKLTQLLASQGLSTQQRPETISISEYGALSEAMIPYLRPEFLPERRKGC